MKKVYLFILLIAFAVSALNAQMNTEKLMEKAKAGVVYIETANGLGTGFLVSDYGHIVTNYHVMDGGWYSSSIEFADGTVYRRYSVVDRDESHDLALLKIENFRKEGQQVLPILKTGNAQSGWDAATIGHPKGSKFTINKGIISKEMVDKELDFVLMTDVPVNPGNSGGPLFNKNGLVVGVVVARIEKRGWWERDVQNMNLAITATQLRKFLNESNVRMQHEELLSDAEIGTAARQLTAEEEEAMKESNIALTKAEEEKRKNIIAEEEKKERERIEQEKALERERIEHEKFLQSLNAKQKAELQQQEFEAETAKKALQSRLDLQRLEEQKEREWLKLQEDKLQLEKDKLRHFQNRKEYFASLPGRFGFRIGGGANYYLGSIAELGNFSFDPNIISWQSQCMIGYRFDINKSKNRGTWAGLGIKYGSMNSTGLDKMESDQSLNNFSKRSLNSFAELELGVMLREWFKIGFGLGRQYVDDSGLIKPLNYKMVSLGTAVRFGPIELDWTNYFLFDDLYRRPALKTELSLFFCFKAGKF